MSKGRGGGKTPERLVELLKMAVETVSIRSISKNTGLGLAPISRYLKGNSEPSQASLEKLSAYFGVSVSYLRGESGRGSTRQSADEDAELLIDQLSGLIEVYRTVPDQLKGVVELALCSFREEVVNSLGFHGPNIGEEKTMEIQKLLDEADAILGLT